MTTPIFGLALKEGVLSIDGSFLFIFFSILLLIYILNHTLFKPINRVLDERESLGAGRIGEARRMLGEYEERLKRYESRLRDARGEAYQRLEAGLRLDQLQETLSERQAELVRALREEGGCLRAAAARCGMADGTAKATLHRIRKKIGRRV